MRLKIVALMVLLLILSLVRNTWLSRSLSALVVLIMVGAVCELACAWWRTRLCGLAKGIADLRRLTRVIAAAMALWISPLTADANDTWQGTSGDWNTAANWTDGVPTANVYADICNGGTVTISQPGATCDTLTLGDRTGTGAVEMTSGSLNINNNEDVGWMGEGTFTQAGGTNSGNQFGKLSIGIAPGVSGTYRLIDGQLTIPGQYVGINGVGNFYQSGGTNSCDWLRVAYNYGQGTYDLRDGQLSISKSLYVGMCGNATFNQWGGTNNVPYITIGIYSSSHGTYNLRGGVLIISSLYGNYNPTFNFSGGTFQAGKTFSTTVPMNLDASNGGATFDTAGYALTLAGSLSGTGGLKKVGSGELILTGNNTFTGGVTLSAGQLDINSPTSLGAAAGKFTVSGVATIDNTSGAPLTLSANNPQVWNSNFTFAGTQDLNLGNGPVALGGNCVVTVSANTLTVGGNITGAHSWAKTGVGTLTLTGDNTFTGGMVLSGGRLNINSPTALGAVTGKFSIYGASTIDNTSGAPLTLSNNPQAWNTSFTFAGTQDLNLGAGPVTLSGDRVVTVSASTLTVGGKISGSYALTKAGLGTLALTAANTYTGATTINAGKLLVNGSLASPVTINSGATLGGNGTITRLLTVNAAGTLAPGNSIGTLTLNGGLTLASGAKLDFELGATTASDLISMSSSTLTLGGQQFSDFRFTSLDGFGMGMYTLIDAGSISGSLGTNTAGMINGLPATLSVSGSDVTLTVVPEPSTVALLGMGALGLLGITWRRRKA